jgi:hypothetical protein
MRNILLADKPPSKPASIIPYFDVLVLWLPTPVDQRMLERLRKHCGDLHCGTHPARWNRRWGQGFQQRLEFKQPRAKALRWIARRDDGRINYMHVTLDYIYPLADRAADRTYLYRHLTRRWHCSQKIKFWDDDEEDTRYDGPPTAPNLIVVYQEDHSRITGECYCLHVEWRAKGVDAVCAAGVRRSRDVLTFDHRAFWKERLRLYAVDPGRLGRLFRNRKQGTRQHAITDADIARGKSIMCRYTTMQGLLDGLGPLRIGHVLTPLSAEPFLPVTLYMLSTNPNYDNLNRRDNSQIDVMRRGDDSRRTPSLTLYNKTFPRMMRERSSADEPK